MMDRQTNRKACSWCETASSYDHLSCCVMLCFVCLQWEGDVCDGVVVAGHGQLGRKVAEGTSKEVASTRANEELKRQPHTQVS